MSFGQQSGPPASDKQVRYLLALVQKAGYADFREARHPLSLNQRQAKGKFTREEASELIDRLLDADAETEASAGTGAASDETPSTPATSTTRPAAAASGKAPKAPAGRATAREPHGDGAPGRSPRSGTAPKQARTIREVPLDRLVAELERRGYTVVPAAAPPPASPDQDCEIT